MSCFNNLYFYETYFLVFRMESKTFGSACKYFKIVNIELINLLATIHT